MLGYLKLVFILISLLPLLQALDEPKSRLLLREKFKNQDFVFNLTEAKSSSLGNGGSARQLNIDTFPVIAGQGVSYTLIDLDPCGVNLPHVHPRGTELAFYIFGGTLRTGFVEENGGRVIINDIMPGQVVVVPQGLIHYAQNLDCKPARFIAAFNNEDPGTVTVSTRTFALPNEALTVTFNQSPEEIEALKKGLPVTLAMGREECLRRCSIF